MNIHYVYVHTNSQHILWPQRTSMNVRLKQQFVTTTLVGFEWFWDEVAWWVQPLYWVERRVRWNNTADISSVHVWAKFESIFIMDDSILKLSQ